MATLVYAPLAAVILFLLLAPVSCSWTQQYGDQASTNYIPQPVTPPVRAVWNYTVPNDYAYYPVSVIYNSPALSENGVIFLPFVFARPHPVMALFQVRAISPNGKELWITAVAPVDEACASELLTNTLYNAEHQMVIIGWDCARAFPYYERAGQLIALDANNGSIIWKTAKLKLLDVATISMTTDTIFVSSGYDCNLDGQLFYNNQTDDSLILAVELLTGNVSWTLIQNHAGCRVAQTKVASLSDGTHLVVIPVNIPGGPYPGGDLLSFICQQSDCQQKWLAHLRVTYDGRYAFTDDGTVLFGNYGLAGNGPEQVFGVDTETGQLLFSTDSACDPGTFPSGPAVDSKAIAYYSCGNRVFAINSAGTLQWKSKIISDTGYTFDSVYKLSPSIHLDRGLILFYDANSTYLYALSSNDGSLYGSYSITSLRGYNGCTEPPILVGDVVYIIKAEADYSMSFLYSLPLFNVLLY